MPLDAGPSVETTIATRRRFRPRLSLGAMMAVVALAAVPLANQRSVSQAEALAIVEDAVRNDSKRWGPWDPPKTTGPVGSFGVDDSLHLSIGFVPRSPGSSRGSWAVTPHRGPHGCSNGAYYVSDYRRPFGSARVDASKLPRR